MPRPVHECVQEHVTAAKLSNSEIAAATGWSEQRVYRLLSGRTEITAVDMRVLAELLGKTVAELDSGLPRPAAEPAA